MQGAVVKLRGDFMELCTLNLNQSWDSKTAFAHGPRAVLGFVGKEKGGGKGYWGPSVGIAKFS